MEKAEILKKVVILPIIIGVIAGIIFCVCFSKGTSKIFSLADGVAIAYHDNLDDGDGATAGVLVAGNEQIDIKYDTSYSNLAHSIIVTNVGNGFDEIGCVYLQCSSTMLDSISGCDEIEIQFNGKTLKYRHIDSANGKTEYEVTHYSPKASKSVVIYCQGAKNGGILNTFNALAFEEVE